MASLPGRAALIRPLICSSFWLLVLAGCHSPEEDFERFLRETEEARKEMPPIASSHYENLNGRWLVNSLLAGGLALGLRMRFTVDETQAPVALTAEIWTTTGDPAVDPPLTTLQTTVAADGRFTLRAEPLELKQGAVKGLSVDVRANVVMDCYTQSADEWCGGASGKVFDPLELDLTNSTLGARRDDQGTVQLMDVPNHCPAP
jgi:hypothetical protein